MIQRIITWLINTFWGLIATSVVVVGLFLSLGRYYLPLIDNFRGGFEHRVSEMLSAQVSSDGLTGDWQGFNPIVGVRHLLVQGDVNQSGSRRDLVAVNEAHLEIDMLRSLLARSPVYREAIVSGLQIHFYKSEAGWQSPLFQGGGGINIADLYAAAHDLRLVNAQLIFHDDRQVNIVSLASFSLERGGNLTQSILSIVDNVNDSPTDVVVESRGKVGEKDFSLTAYLHANNVDLSPYRFLSTQFLRSDHASLALWANWRTGEALKIHGSVSATNFSVGSLLDVATAKANIGLSYEAQQWVLFSQDAEFESGGHEVTLPDFRVDIDGNTSVSKLSLNELDLALSSQVHRFLPEQFTRFAAALKGLAPQGQLRNIAVTMHHKNDAWQLALGADAVELSVNAWRGAPAFKGVSGKVQHQGRSGWIVSEQDDMSLYMAELQTQPLALKQLSGRIGWDIGEHITIASDGILASSIYGDLEVQFSLDLAGANAREKPVPTLTLQLRMVDMPAVTVADFFPNLASMRGVKQWLREGDLTGSFPAVKALINTSISKKEQWFPTMQVVAQANSLDLFVSQEWPRVEMGSPALLMSHRQLKAVSTDAKLLDIVLTPLTVDVALNKQATHVQMHADGLGPMQSALYLFQHSLLADVINNGADGWRGNGDFSAAVDVGFSLENLSDVKAHVQASLIDTRLRLDEAELQFEHVQGQISYHDGLLSSQQLTADVFTKPWQLQLSTDTDTNDYLLAGTGNVAAGAIADWLEQPLLLFLQGETPAQALLRIRTDAPPELTIDTAMEGIAINLPAPLHKRAEQPLTTSINVVLSEDIALSVRSPNMQLDAVLANEVRGVVAVGYKKPLPVMPEAGFEISGGLSQLDGAAALDSLDQYLDFSTQYPSVGPATNIVLKAFTIDRLLLGDEFVPNAVVSGYNEGAIWHADISAEVVNASVRWEEEKPLVLNIEHIGTFPALALAEIITPPTPWRPTDLVALEVSIASIEYDGEDYGRWRFDVQPQDNAVMFNHISGSFKGVTVAAASLLWSETELGQHSSVFQGSASANNVKEVFEGYALEPMLASKTARATVGISWPNEPFNIDLLRMSGDVDFQLEDGQFLRTEGAPTGILKLLGVFNFDNLVRRMRLDFGDLVHEGLSYDRFSGAVTLAPGEVHLSKPIFVEGPSSDFRMTGSLDLSAQTVDGELIAVVPVSRNLPWLAALAGGLPAAAGLYLVSKVFSDEFDRLSSASYSINGPWAEPEIKFERLFDDKNKLPSEKEAAEEGLAEPLEQQAE